MEVMLRLFFLFIPACCLMACAVNPPPDTRPWSVRAAERLVRNQDPERITLVPQQAAEDLKQALQLYALADHQEGQVRCHLNLARLYLRSDSGGQAGVHLEKARRIAARLGHRHLQFEAALLTALRSNRRADFQQALGYASSAIERAVALTYLGQSDQAYQAISARLDKANRVPDDFAFVLYRYAEANRDRGAARQSLALYKQADNPAGIAEALYLLGRLAAEDHESDLARDYLERALAVSGALNDQPLMQRIEAALEAI